MTVGKNRSILAGNHPAAIIDSPFYQRISGIKLILSFHIEDQSYFFSVRGPRAFIARRYSSSKADIKSNFSFCYRSVFHSCPLYHRSALSFVRCHRGFSNLWFLFNVLFCNLMDIAVHVLPKAALHDPCKNDLFCQKAFAGCVIVCFFISGRNVFCNRCFRDEEPPFFETILTRHYIMRLFVIYYKDVIFFQGVFCIEFLPTLAGHICSRHEGIDSVSSVSLPCPGTTDDPLYLGSRQTFSKASCSPFYFLTGKLFPVSNFAATSFR